MRSRPSEMRFEIARRKYTFLKIYAFIILIIILLAAIIANRSIDQNRTFGTTEVFLLGAITVLLYILLKVVPSLRLSKHSKTGYIHFSTNSITIERESKNEEISISEIDHLEMKLNGYNGQPKVGTVKSYYPDLCPVDGLSNLIKISYKTTQVRLEFYIDSVSDYKELKQIIKEWPTLTKTKMNVLR